MKIVLAGPIETSALARATGLDLTGWPAGYTQTPMVPVAAELLARGHEVHIVTTDSSLDTIVDRRQGSLTVSFCPLRGAPRYRARWRMMDLFAQEISHLRNAIVAAEPDIVHAFWTYEFAEAAVRSRLPHLVTMHDLGWEYLFQFRDLYRLVRLGMKYRVMPRVRHLSVVSPFMRRSGRYYGYFGPVDIIPNGIALPPEAAPDSSRLAAPCIVTIGNTGPLKNVGVSVRAFRRIRAALPAAELHLFGPGLDADYVRGEVGVMGHGNVSHPVLMNFLAERAALLVHTSRFETFGVILAEAKARSVPVIGGIRAGGVPYVIGETGGIAVNIDDADAVADAALDILTDPVRYTALAAQARQDAEWRFSIGMVTEAYLSVYSKILGRPID